jgi:hypothetical protein
MSETYADDYEREPVGGFIVVAISILSAVLVLAGLFYAAGAHARTKSALAVNNCEPSMSPSGLPCNSQQMVIGEYNGIVNPASKLLATDMAAYIVNERHHLAAAEAALTSEVATEQALDKSLAAIAYTSQNYANAINLITIAFDSGGSTPGAAILLTPQATVIANAAVRDNQALATLTTEQARSKSLTQLRSFNTRVEADTAAVQAEMKLIGKTLATPITAAQEP